MFGSNTLDIAIGLVSLFLVLSLMATAANELIEAFLKRRAKDLARGIKELVGSDGTTDFIKDFYAHGLINSLFKGKYDPTNEKDLPSYIPSQNFALAILDVAKTFEAKAAAATDDHSKSLSTLPTNVRTALETLKAAAGADMQKYQKSVEDWYNSAMDRVAGWYKRRSQKTIFVIGLVLVIITNADCINYAKRLSTDSSLRQSVVAFAEATAKTNPATDDSKKTPLDKIKDGARDVGKLGLPIGWEDFKRNSDTAPTWERPLGWLLTTLAVSLGAPFWFDILNKIMVIRSTVKPHEKSKEEKPKDPRG